MLRVPLLIVTSLLLTCDVTRGDELETLKATVERLSRHVMSLQLMGEEKARVAGASGIQQVRVYTLGQPPYHIPAHSSRGAASAHNHANNDRTVGLGEFVASLNGVEFRTRHNDYRLNMPSRNSSEFHAYEPIPFPDVPPAVLQKSRVEDQITEMKEWFKAWQTQDSSVRDYTKYFKPTLCYLEGQWTVPKSDGSIDESFDSDRHFINAATWNDLQDKIRFTSEAGRKDNQENLAYLPTTIVGIRDGVPVMAQWNYRIMCHPLKRDVPLDRLKCVDDIAHRMANQFSMKQHCESRAARFAVNLNDDAIWEDGFAKRSFLDDLMEEIPGLDNYAATLVDDGFGEPAYDLDPKVSGGVPGVQNAARYARWYRVMKKGAMGLQTRRRGFSDPNIFMAMNTQDRVAATSYTACKKQKGQKQKECKTISQKWSYAVPLEIVYMTPLSKWNPYNVEYKGSAKSDAGKTVNAGGRNGKMDKTKAYDGTNSKIYYRTPEEFFTGSEGRDPADTTAGKVGVLDRNGDVRAMRASGHYIQMPAIAGVGKLRQRYPIYPLTSDGNPVYKEFTALKDILKSQQRYGFMLTEQSDDGNDAEEGYVYLRTRASRVSTVEPHQHCIRLTMRQMAALEGGDIPEMRLVTYEATGHSHDVTIKRTVNKRGMAKFLIAKCDSKGNVCWDNHPRVLDRVADDSGC